jgi:hypothetical protein
MRSSQFSVRRMARSRMQIHQRVQERASLCHRLPSTIPDQQLLRPPGQHSPELTLLSLYPGNHHTLVPGLLVAHPGDHGSFGSLLDRDGFGSGNRTTPDQGGTIGDGPCKLVGEFGVVGMKSQERQHRTEKVLDVLGLGLVKAVGVGYLPRTCLACPERCPWLGRRQSPLGWAPGESPNRPGQSGSAAVAPCLVWGLDEVSDPGSQPSKRLYSSVIADRPAARAGVRRLLTGVTVICRKLPASAGPS